jgi:hypothetical protein
MIRAYTGAEARATAANLADIIGESHLVTAIVADLAATVAALEAERDALRCQVEAYEAALDATADELEAMNKRMSDTLLASRSIIAPRVVEEDR